jgi:hypothetical protein
MIARRTGVFLALALALVAAGCSSAPARTSGTRSIAESPSIPLTRVTFSGHRYVVAADLGVGRPVPLMVHGNSGMFLSVTHEVGEQVIGGPVAKVEEFGYSARGKGLIAVPALALGEARYTHLREVPVFDFAEERGTPVQGMLGVPFLTAARAVVDFSKGTLTQGAPVTPEPDAGLLRAGYVSVPMTPGPDGKVTISVYFPALGRAVAITPSTVSTALSLHRPIFDGKTPMARDSVPNDLSPRGTTPAVFVTDAVDYEIAGRKLRSAATFQDWAEYAQVAEKDLRSFGMLGFDWMDQHRAVLDYANLRLYFIP